MRLSVKEPELILRILLDSPEALFQNEAIRGEIDLPEDRRSADEDGE